MFLELLPLGGCFRNNQLDIVLQRVRNADEADRTLLDQLEVGVLLVSLLSFASLGSRRGAHQRWRLAREDSLARHTLQPLMRFLVFVPEGRYLKHVF